MTEIHCPKCGGEAQVNETQTGKMSTTYVCECEVCKHTWEVVG